MESGKLEVGGKRVLVVDVFGGLYRLKKTLRSDIGSFERDFMFRAGQEGAREYLSDYTGHEPSADPRTILEMALTAFTSRGYGEFKLEKYEPELNTIEIVCLNSAEAWPYQANNDLQRESTCSYMAGALTWMCRSVLAPESPLDLDLSVYESECYAAGANQCTFVFAPNAVLRSRFPEYAQPRRLVPEQVLKLNEDILAKNLELQNLNLSLERHIRKKTEELWRAEENYNLLMRLSPDPIALILTSSRIQAMNPKGLKMFGLDSVQEAQNESMVSFMVGGKAAWDNLLWQIEKEGSVQDFELELRRKDGSKVNATVSARYAELLPGKCIEAVIRDLTERKQMERQIDEAKSESEFLNDLLSHDIMNFTFSALHFMNGLWKSPRISDDDRRDLAMAMKDIQGAYELTSSVRDLSRIRHIDKDELIIKDLRHLLAEASEETKRLFPDRNVSVNFEKGVDPRYVTCTPLAVRLFTNILTNAVKYDPKQEVVVDIEVESLVKDGQVYWKVKMADTGRGIPDAEKERIFERFHRLDQSVSGTGLGLYVAKFIAEAGGGKIWAENRVEGDHTKGTVIVVLMRKVDERDIALMTRRP